MMVLLIPKSPGYKLSVLMIQLAEKSRGKEMFVVDQIRCETIIENLLD